ncbi:MAG TPA: AsmA family protein [bacterium]|nr:AsmA family protein [bacterium]
MTATRNRSKWLRIGGGVLLVLVALLLVPFVVPVDRFRPLIVRLVEENTGRKVEIEALRLRLLPTVHLQVVNLRVKHPGGFPPGDTLAVKSVDVGTTLGSLLSRRPDVTYVAFNGVRVNLLESPGGATNYGIAGVGGRPANVNAAGPRNAPVFALARIDSVAARNVEITSGVYDPRRGLVTPSFAVAGVNARVRGINVTAPDWMSGMEVAADLGGITVSTPALSRPLRIQKGSFSFKAGEAKGTFAASLDTLSAVGVVTVANLKDPVADFEITVPELDVDRLRTLVAGGGAVSRGGTGAPRRLLARGAFKVARLAARPMEGGTATGRIRVYTDRVEVDPYSLALYGGTVRGTAVLDSAAAHQPALVTAQVRGVDFGRVVKALAPAAKQQITGTLEVDGRLALALGGDPLASLTGAGTFAVRNGTLPGLDMRNTLVALARVAQVNIPAGPTKFQYFGGDFRIAQQRVYSDALRLEAEGLDAVARGSFGFNRTLDYTGTGHVKGSLGSAQPQGQPGTPSSLLGNLLGGTLPGGAFDMRVSFSLKGTFDDPKFAPAGMPQLNQGTNPAQPQRPAGPGNPFNLFPLPVGP